MKVSNDIIQSRVDKGAKLLDVEVDDWRERINPDELWLESPMKCVLGQVFSSYSSGMEALGIDITDDVTTVEFGFEAENATSAVPLDKFSKTEMLQEYVELSNEWKRRLSGVSKNA